MDGPDPGWPALPTAPLNAAVELIAMADHNACRGAPPESDVPEARSQAYCVPGNMSSLAAQGAGGSTVVGTSCCPGFLRVATHPAIRTPLVLLVVRWSADHRTPCSRCTLIFNSS